MLKILFKHDWKETWKFPTILIAFLMGASLLLGLSFLTPLWQFDSLESLPFISLMFIFMFYYILIIGVALGVSIYIGIRFYKNVYTDEGYLTHTLPVTPRNILISKTLVGAIWGFFSILSIAICVGFILFTLFISLSSGQLGPLWEEMSLVIDGPTVKSVILFCITMVVGFFSGPLMMYCSIALGQFYTKHRILGAIIAYFGISTLIQILTSIIIIPHTMQYMIALDNNPNQTVTMLSFIDNTYLATLIITIMTSIAFFIITEYCMKKKLNLE